MSRVTDAVAFCTSAIDGALRSTGRVVVSRWHAINGSICSAINQDLHTDFGGIRCDNITLTFQDALWLARFIDNWDVGTNHRSIWNNNTWTMMYQLADRHVNFMDNMGNSYTIRCQTMPCHNCGIVLPRDYIQVDHYMPQAGGADRYVLKTLRSLLLTTAGPTGNKGPLSYRGPLIIQPKANARGDYSHLALATPGNKWTTNAYGTAFLSLLQHGKRLDDLRDACKNSMLNLAPLCATCNRQKSNTMRPIQ